MGLSALAGVWLSSGGRRPQCAGCSRTQSLCLLSLHQRSSLSLAGVNGRRSSTSTTAPVVVPAAGEVLGRRIDKSQQVSDWAHRQGEAWEQVAGAGSTCENKAPTPFNVRSRCCMLVQACLCFSFEPLGRAS